MIFGESFFSGSFSSSDRGSSVSLALVSLSLDETDSSLIIASIALFLQFRTVFSGFSISSSSTRR